MIPHLCKNDSGARKTGCKACTSRYNRDYRKSNWERLRRPRKVRSQYLPPRILGALKLGFPLSLHQLWRMLGCPWYPTLINACYELQRRGLVAHERIPKADSQRGGMYQAMRWEAV